MAFLKDQLDNEEIRRQLRKPIFPLGTKLKKKDVDYVVQLFWFYDFYNSLISFPPYLKHLISYFRGRGSHKVVRSEFYNFFLKKIIGKSKQKLKYLQKIALTMELMRTNELPIKDFQKLLKKLKIDPEKINLKDLTEKSLFKLSQEEGKSQNIGFYHHTIQEFLAAKYFLDRKDPVEATQSVMILEQKRVKAFKPSWYGVLRFLFESPGAKKFLQWIVSFADKHKETVDDSFADIITSIELRLAPEFKAEIFDLIYGEYFWRQLWLPVWARSNLGRFCSPKHLLQFKKDIEPTDNKTETFVHQGNIAAIIDGILQNNPKLLTSKEKAFWKKKLVEFARDNNKNGVLQRHSLSALVRYRDSSLISQVAKAFDHEDRLVKEAFFQFCYRTAPNYSQTIDYLVEGIKQGLDIYGRYGLYEISSKEGISYLLKKFIEDEPFFKRFLYRESIFNAGKEKVDKRLLTQIRKAADDRIIGLLKKLISTAFYAEELYRAEESYFLQQLALLIQSRDSNYLMEILAEIGKYKKDEGRVRGLLYNYRNLFGLLIQKESLIEFFEKVLKLHEGAFRDAELAVYIARDTRGQEGQEIFDLAVAKKLIKRLPKKDIFKKQQQKRDEEIYKEFKRLLEPEKGRYFPTVFQYYLGNRGIIEKHWKKEEKARLIKLAIDEGLEKIDPQKIKVRISNLGESDKRYTISTVASYYGDILRVGQILFPRKLSKYREQIINFIPHAYSDDRQTILEIVRAIPDKDLTFVNKIYQDRQDDRRYLLPSAYIYLIGEYLGRGCKLNSPPKVLKSFIGDDFISESDQEYALERLGELANEDDFKTKAYFNRVFRENENKKIGEVANALLITIFKDGEAIDWRFSQLKKRVFSHIEPPPGEVYTISPREDELSSLHFAKPLIELGDIKYSPKFFDLLRYSFKQLNEPEEKNLRPYVNYLWRVVIKFVDRLKEKGSFDPVVKLEEWVEKNANFEGSNWFKGRIDELYRVYIDAISVEKSIDEAVLQVEALEGK